ncbi:zinc finger CCCH domain-containing protein 6 [Malania oleifera]|uniref:zinc finger CCCH domain-containing protein 6 n=1 Tax=Malania oleifera TaxID=397392 RepID=UPI0025AEBA61|nr:zinc finger CCCH domain-containing protein 6 [Malania oleifera]
MRGLQKSKRISWAPDGNLCQVRLFLSEDSPSQVGLGAQDHLQAKASWMLHSSGMGSDDSLPPGFEGANSANQLMNKLSQITLCKWRCPPRYVLNFTWQVVAGEESKEVEVQNKREMRVLEAVYPRPSAIPPNPSVTMNIEDSNHDDQHTPLVPMTPIEDEEGVTDILSDSMASTNVLSSLQPPSLGPGISSASQCSAPNALNTPAHEGAAAAGMALGVEPDALAAASAAAAAIMSSSEQGCLIDRNLLVKILSNPKLVEKLVVDHGTTTNPQAIPKPTALPNAPPAHINRTETGTPSSVTTSGGSFYPAPNGVGPVPSPRPSPPGFPVPSPSSVGTPLAKDINYYKSLIQQHGGERQETVPQFSSHHNNHLFENNIHNELVNTPRPRDMRPKINKPCIYFNSSRGCRNGANCAYQHDASFPQRVASMQEVQSAKRMKMDREITGT